MLDTFFNQEEKTIHTMELQNFEIGKMTLNIPSLSERNIVSQINDANQISYFGCIEQPISLHITSGDLNQQSHNIFELKFNEGYVFSSLLKSERDEGIYYLKLKDGQNKDWEFKISDNMIVSCQAKIEMNFTQGVQA